MLQSHITSFLDYCRLANFSQRSQQALAIRLHEFRVFLKIRKVELITDITYLDLSDFVGEFKRPSVHVKKSRFCTLRQFYHFLSLHGHVAENIAAELPYPKIEKTVPAFLTQEQMDRLVRYFRDQADGSFRSEKPGHLLAAGHLGAENLDPVHDRCPRCRYWVRAVVGHRKGTALPLSRAA